MNTVFLATSDFHGYLPITKEPFDCMLICGDVCPATNHSNKFQKEWLSTEFVEWVDSLNINEGGIVILIPGNHDWYFQGLSKKKITEFEDMFHGKLKLLINETYDFHGIKIFGTPYCKIFYNWAFMRDNDKLWKYYSECPDDVDIIMSHDAPTLNELGLIHQGWSYGTDAGNPLLDQLIKQKKPKVFLCGHIHSGNHEMEMVDGTAMANVSYIDEDYRPANPLLRLMYDDETRTIIHGTILDENLLWK